MSDKPNRRGYAMMLVLVFIVMILSLYGLSFRYLTAVLRTETTRTLRTQRDEGAIQALAVGLELLETGFPPTDPYVCAVSLVAADTKRSFTVTFRSESDDTWSVRAAPTGPWENPQPTPNTFAPDSASTNPVESTKGVPKGKKKKTRKKRTR